MIFSKRFTSAGVVRRTLCVRAGLVVAVSLLATPPTLAQSSEPARVLLPIALTLPTEGAHGSRWLTDLTIYNKGDRSYVIGLDNGCRFGTICQPEYIEPGRTVIASKLIAGGGGGMPISQFVHLESAGMSDVKFQLRVRDLSREKLGWGTEIPAVPESEAFTDTLQLLDVPLLDHFRSRLRVYDFDPGQNRAVRVRFFEITTSIRFAHDYPPDELLAERTMGFVTSPPDFHSPSQSIPGMIELPLDSIPELAGVDRIRIEIEPITPGLRFWAMASITNNETQHVTIISPDRD